MDRKFRPPIAYLLETPQHSFLMISNLLEEAGFQIQRHDSLASLVEHWKDHLIKSPSAVLAHVADGGLMMARLRAENATLPNTPIILLDDHRDATRAIQAIRLHVADYLLLDSPIDELRVRIYRLWQQLIDDAISIPIIEEAPELIEPESNGIPALITWDESLNAVRRGDTWISLSPIEWRLFHTLVNRRGAVVPLEDLVLKGLQRDSSSNADVPLLRLHISRLRSKLNDNFGHELNVVTLRGRGYMLV